MMCLGRDIPPGEFFFQLLLLSGSTVASFSEDLRWTSYPELQFRVFFSSYCNRTVDRLIA